ncbi:MAG: phosphotransferase [Actinomycetota bacterium]|nr:phosphotransferase [Actinomycetota bacterium]
MSASGADHGDGPAPEDPLPAALVADALARFGLGGPAKVEFLRHGENTTYAVTGTDGRRYALRVHRLGYQTEPAIRSELAWMENLCRSGIRTPIAVPGVDGDPVQTATDPAGWSRTAVLFGWIDAVPLSTVREAEPWERLGELMARVHAHARAWRPPTWFTRPAWDAQALVGDEPRWGPPDPERRFGAGDCAALEACRAEVRARLAAIGTGPDRFGLIHGDLGFENVLVTEDGTVVIIDFDDSGNSWYLHDFAVALYPHEGSSGLRDRRQALVDGYRRASPLPDDLLAELPTFLMARRIQTLGWVFSRPETAHAQRQAGRRLASTPKAALDFLAWARDNPP